MEDILGYLITLGPGETRIDNNDDFDDADAADAVDDADDDDFGDDNNNNHDDDDDDDGDYGDDDDGDDDGDSDGDDDDIEVDDDDDDNGDDDDDMNGSSRRTVLKQISERTSDNLLKPIKCDVISSGFLPVGQEAPKLGQPYTSDVYINPYNPASTDTFKMFP